MRTPAMVPLQEFEAVQNKCEQFRAALHAIGYMDDFMSKETAIEMMHIARNALTLAPETK